MPKIHPHAEATYRIISLPGGSFGVEVNIPDSYPTTVSKFRTKSDASAWIAKHKSRVEAESSQGRWFQKAGSRPNSLARH